MALDIRPGPALPSDTAAGWNAASPPADEADPFTSKVLQKKLDIQPGAAPTLSKAIDIRPGPAPVATQVKPLDIQPGTVVPEKLGYFSKLKEVAGRELEAAKRDIISPEKPYPTIAGIGTAAGRMLALPVAAPVQAGVEQYGKPLAKEFMTKRGVPELKAEKVSQDIADVTTGTLLAPLGANKNVSGMMEEANAARTAGKFAGEIPPDGGGAAGILKAPALDIKPGPAETIKIQEPAYQSKIFTPDPPAASTKPITTPGGIADQLYADRMRSSADAKELGDFIKKNPVSPELARKFGEYEDDPKSVPLTPEEQVMYDRAQKPMYDEVQAIREEFGKKKLDLDDIVASEDAAEAPKGGAIRQVVGKNTPMDRLLGTQEKTPILQRIKNIVAPVVGRRSLSKSAGVLKPRNMFALEQNGNRQIVHLGEDGKLYDAAKPDREVGEIIEGKEVKTPEGKAQLADATRKEITAATGGKIKYHENAQGVTATALLQARRAQRVIRTLDALAKAPEAAEVMKGPHIKAKNIPKDWVEIPGVPALRGKYFEPRFAEEIEDHLAGARRGMGELSTLENLNRFMLASFFWLNPAHIYNVAEAFAVTKGAGGFVKDLPSTAVDFLKSVKSVATRDKTYMQGARAGVPYKGLDMAAAKFSKDLLGAVTARAKDDPRGFTEFAKAFGMKPLDLIKKISQLSHDATFSFQDMLQQTLERGLARKGVGQGAATEQIARTLPNYRTGARILGSRVLGKAMKGSAWFQFPGWDVGRLTGLGNMLKGAAKLDPKSLDQLLMIAVLYEFGKQVVNPALQQATNNKQAEGPTAGYGVFPKAAEDLLKGDKTIAQMTQSLFPLGYLPQAAAAWPLGVNLYTGQPISLPGERPAEIAFDYAKAAGQKIDPIRRLMEAREGKGDLQSNIYRQLGAKVPTSEAQASKVKAKKYLKRELKSKRKHEPEIIKDFGR